MRWARALFDAHFQNCLILCILIFIVSFYSLYLLERRKEKDSHVVTIYSMFDFLFCFIIETILITLDELIHSLKSSTMIMSGAQTK